MCGIIFWWFRQPTKYPTTVGPAGSWANLYWVLVKQSPTLVGLALAGPTPVVARWTPRPTIIGLGGRARLNKLGSWQKDPTVGHPFGPNDARQQGPTSLGHAWHKNPATLGLAAQQDPTSLGHVWQNDPAALTQNNRWHYSMIFKHHLLINQFSLYIKIFLSWYHQHILFLWNN